MSLPSLKIKNFTARLPIIQGGMGIGISNYKLAGTVAKEGGMGVLSSAALDRLVSERHGKKFKAREAAAQDVIDAKAIANGGPIGMNCMVAVINQYEDSILGSMDGGVDAIVSGAGLPMALPEIAKKHERFNEVALIPILSSGRAVDVVLRRWERSQVIPDAIIVEGPLAGGHIAWKTLEEANNPQNRLDILLEEVISTLDKRGLKIPVIAAGGIYTYEDIVKALDMGCAGVQMGTRFAATIESGANENYKKLIIEAKEEDIELASRPGSPCGMLFRVLKKSPFYQEALERSRAPKCDKGYLLNKGFCPSKYENEKTFCICNGLLSAVNMNKMEKELYTVGATAYRVDKILSVHDLMQELSHPTKTDGVIAGSRLTNSNPSAENIVL